MKPFQKWIPTAALIVAALVALHYMGVLTSKTTVGIALTAMSVLLFLSVLLTPHNDE